MERHGNTSEHGQAASKKSNSSRQSDFKGVRGFQEEDQVHCNRIVAQCHKTE